MKIYFNPYSMNPGHDSAVLCNTGSIFGSKLFYSDFLMRSSREKKGKKTFAWMKVDGWVMPINDFLFIYLFSSLLNTRATHYCVIRGFRFVKLRTHPKQTKKNRE